MTKGIKEKFEIKYAMGRVSRLWNITDFYWVNKVGDCIAYLKKFRVCQICIISYNLCDFSIILYKNIYFYANSIVTLMLISVTKKKRKEKSYTSFTLHCIVQYHLCHPFTSNENRGLKPWDRTRPTLAIIRNTSSF